MYFIETTLKEAVERFPEVRRLTLSTANEIPIEDESSMEYFLDGGLGKRNPRVNVCFDENNKPIAWAWMLNYEFQKNSLALMMFVDPNFRRKRIGSKLYDWAKSLARKRHRRFYAFPWDNRSDEFYNKSKCKNIKQTYWDD